jgi:chaperonin GroES
MKTRFEPLPGKIILKAETKATQYLTNSGLFLLQHNSDSSNLAEVIAVYEPFIDPEDGLETEANIKVGDLVLYGKHSGVRLQVGRETYIALRESECITKVHFQYEEGDPTALKNYFPLPADFDDVSRLTQAVRNVEDHIG